MLPECIRKPSALAVATAVQVPRTGNKMRSFGALNMPDPAHEKVHGEPRQIGG